MSTTTPAVLFITNGHGEVAIAERIARELPPYIVADHVALVGASKHDGRLREVGPRAALPSGGLIAMANVRNIVRDLRAGLAGHTLTQWRYLSGVQSRYAVTVAVGDVLALVMALHAHGSRTIYVGTAKSIYVARYGALEARILSRANRVFVRDEPTARDLRARGVAARAANVIVDLYTGSPERVPGWSLARTIAVFPGSREGAYADAVVLCRIVRALRAHDASVGAVLSIAPSLDGTRMKRDLSQDGWSIVAGAGAHSPFTLSNEQGVGVCAWTGSLGAMLAIAEVVLGQAGTANEAAAAAGIPVLAYEAARRPQWYRKRQIALLDGALKVLTGSVTQAAEVVDQLLHDPVQRARMGAIGRERMGPSGAAARIATEIAHLCG